MAKKKKKLRSKKNTLIVEKFTCNRCHHTWIASKAEKCTNAQCGSLNIEIGKGRPREIPTYDRFHAGDTVKFRGLKYQGKTFLPFDGKLKAVKNTVEGAVTIVDEPFRLIFNPDGTLYCHAHLGILLEKPKKIKVAGPVEGRDYEKRK